MVGRVVCNISVQYRELNQPVCTDVEIYVQDLPVVLSEGFEHSFSMSALRSLSHTLFAQAHESDCCGLPVEPAHWLQF